MMKYIYIYSIILKTMKDETKCYALLSQEKSIWNDSPVVYITNLTFKKIGFPSGCID